MLYRQTSLGLAKLHQQRARLCLGDPLEILDAVVTVVHVEVRDAGTSIQHGKVTRVDGDDAPTWQFAAQEHQVLVNALDVAVNFVCRTLGERLWVRVTSWRLAVEERELLQELVFNVRAGAVLLELVQGHNECAPLPIIHLLRTLLAGTLLRRHWYFVFV